MTEMKYKDLLHPLLQQVLGKIANTQMAPKQSYEVNKLMSAVREQMTKTREESTKILKNFVVFDGDKPKLKVDDKGELMNEVVFIDPFTAEHPDYLKAFEEFEDKMVKINFRPWSLEMLSDIKLSAMEIDILGPLLTDKPFLEAVKGQYYN
jgi:methyl coenzyme M reductase subunit C-like uncharacterized protein (methanogenesis marker protein 7)